MQYFQSEKTSSTLVGSAIVLFKPENHQKLLDLACNQFAANHPRASHCFTAFASLHARHERPPNTSAAGPS